MRGARTVISGLTLGAAIIGHPTLAGAAPVTRTLNGATWSKPADWTPNGAPTIGDSVVLGSNATSRFDIPGLSVKDLTVTGSHRIGAPAGSSITLNGKMTVAAGTPAAPNNVVFDPTVQFGIGGHTVDVGADAQVTFAVTEANFSSLTKVGVGTATIKMESFDGLVYVDGGTLVSDFARSNGSTWVRPGNGVKITGPTDEMISLSGTTDQNPQRLTVDGVTTGIIGTTVGNTGAVVVSGSGEIRRGLSGSMNVTFATKGQRLKVGGSSFYGAAVLKPDTVLTLTDTSQGFGAGLTTFETAAGKGPKVDITAGAKLNDDIVVNPGAQTSIIDTPGGLGVTMEGTLVLNADLPLALTTDGEDDRLLLLKSAVSGAGRLKLDNSGGPATVEFDGWRANTNGGIDVTGSAATLLVLSGTEPAISGSLIGNAHTSLRWESPFNQIADTADVAAGGTIELRGYDETMRHLDARGAALHLGRTDGPRYDASALTVGSFLADAGTSIDMAAGAKQVADNDIIRSRGQVSLAGATLRISSLSPQLDGNPITLIDNLSNLPVGGTFAGLAEGATLTLGDRVMAISYAGGDGNDVVLSAAGRLDPDYVSTVPARLADTRNGGQTVDGASQGGGPALARSTTRVKVAGRAKVPADAIAVALNVTVVGAKAAGYVTVWPCLGPPPNASNLNYVAGSTVPNAVVSSVGLGGEICLFTEAATDLIVDVAGYFPAGSSYTALSPRRLFDSRPGGNTVDDRFAGDDTLLLFDTVSIDVAGRASVPRRATAAVLNVTVVDPVNDGYITVWPCSEEQPNASNLNFRAGETVPNAVVSALGSAGDICVYADQGTELIVDVAGYFTDSSSYEPLVPARLLDSRPGAATIDTVSAGIGPRKAGSTTEVQVNRRGGVPGDARTAVLNITATAPISGGYLTVWPCGAPQPNASSLNYEAGQTIANSVVTAIGAGGKVCLFAETQVHLIVDVGGYFTD